MLRLIQADGDVVIRKFLTVVGTLNENASKYTLRGRFADSISGSDQPATGTSLSFGFRYSTVEAIVFRWP